MSSRESLSKLAQEVKEGNALVREARSDSVELTIAIDAMLGSIITEYFVRHKSRYDLLFEILTLLTTSQKIDAFSNLEAAGGVQYNKKYSKMIKDLRLVNEFRNTLVHGYPSVSYETKLWRGRGKLHPFPLSRDLVEKMMTVGNEAFDGISDILMNIIGGHKSRKRKMPQTRKL